MKRFIYVLSLFVLSSSAIFAQTTAPKVITKTAEVVAVEREKFDPMRVAADDLQVAIVKASAENKRIILDVGGEWCGWCRFMDNFLIKNVALGKLRDENFVWVKINYSDENKNEEFLGAYPTVKGYPHLFVLEEDGKLLHSQDTAALEEEKGYNLQKFTDFLTKWSPERKND
jgi:thiol:disulfide interchange protein